MRAWNPENEVSYSVFDMILVTLTGTAGEIFNTIGSLLEELEGGAGKGGGWKYQKMPTNAKLLLKQVLDSVYTRQPFAIWPYSLHIVLIMTWKNLCQIKFETSSFFWELLPKNFLKWSKTIKYWLNEMYQGFKNYWIFYTFKYIMKLNMMQRLWKH